MNKINIKIAGKTIEAELNNTTTAKKIYAALPINANLNRWGDEIYFKIPVEAEIANGVETLEIGTIAYWPPGKAFCIFFGKTPASTDEKPRAAGPVNVIGKIKYIKDLEVLKSMSSGKKILISKIKN